MKTHPIRLHVHRDNFTLTESPEINHLKSVHSPKCVTNYLFRNTVTFPSGQYVSQTSYFPAVKHEIEALKLS